MGRSKWFPKQETKRYQWDFHEEDEEGREQIHQWSRARQNKLKGLNKTYHGFLVYTFSLNTLKSFIQNFNFMVIIQMILAGISIYIFQRFDITFDIHVSLFVSPIVFPLAFSINTDFQRREKVLEDLATFKSSGMLWYFCMREWKEAAGLDDSWINAVHRKLKSLLFHLREFLLTDRVERRKVILAAMYEDFSDMSQLIEKVRASKLPANTSIVSRVIHLLNMMSLSFERLRVVREYRSPRSIRSFNKVLILLLPIILGPYFVYKARDDDGHHSAWSPYYISILVAMVFSALQGVQDKLDDPFDGMSEDDIDLEQIDEWTFNSLELTIHRTFKIGRFQVNIEKVNEAKSRSTSIIPVVDQKDSNFRRKSFVKKRAPSFFDRHISIKRKNTLRKGDSVVSSFDIESHPYADVLEKITGNTTIARGGIVSLPPSIDSLSENADSFKKSPTDEKVIYTLPSEERPPITLQSLFNPEVEEIKSNVKSKNRTVSFDEKPVQISFSPTAECNPSLPLLTINPPNKMAGSRFKLTHAPRVRGSSSSSSSPPTPSITLVNVVEDPSEAVEMEEKERSIPDLESSMQSDDYLIVDTETNKIKETEKDDVFA